MITLEIRACVCVRQPKTHPKFDSTTAASLAVSAELGMAAAGARGLTGSLDAGGCEACAKRRLHRYPIQYCAEI